VIHAEIEAAGGWIGFDRFMALALYAPGLGYYSRAERPFGTLPGSGSDFVTAPELSPYFGRAFARQVAQALEASGTDEVFEFGAGSGALAAQLIEALDALGAQVRRYTIVDLSAGLRGTQAGALARFAPRVRWLDAWPEPMRGVVVGNEVLDAMPVQLLHFDGVAWHERGVAVAGERFAFADRPTALRPPHDAPFVPGTTTELHAQAEAWIATLAHALVRGAVFLLDYGFPAAEYYHPQRTGGTLMCHRAHRADADPLEDVGTKDITAHVDFSGLALAGQDAGLAVLGYTSQANFLLNCGLLERLPAGDLRATADVHKLLAEHEMGELFKAIGFVAGAAPFDAIGFARGDRTHTL
jgi:SAM-dependent MidA family methyltransferase